MTAPAERAMAGDLRALGAVMAAGAVVLPRLPVVPPGCPLRALTGVPCPLCGMTTGVVATVAGRLGDAVAANPAAPVLVLVVLASWAVWALRRAGVAVPRWSTWSSAAGALPRWAPLPVLAALWLFQLARFGVL